MFEAAILEHGSTEFSDTATVLKELSREREQSFTTIHGNAQANLRLAAKLMMDRKSRDAQFGAGLFSDPAWDIMLALYVGKLQQIRMKTTALIEDSGVPSTTALRWINALSERGYLDKSSNPTDARSTLIEMTDTAAVLMTDFLKRSERAEYTGSLQLIAAR